MLSEEWGKRLRMGGQVLLSILVVGYLLVMLADISSLRSNITAMAGDISSLRSDVSSIQSDVNSIQDTVNSIEQDLEDITTDDQPDAGRSVAKRHRDRMYAPRLVAWHRRSRRFSRSTTKLLTQDPQESRFHLAKGN